MHVPKNRHFLDKGIEERPVKENGRYEIGHWQIHTIEGLKSRDNALAMFVELKTRYSYTILLYNQEYVSII
ncbi:hypothetical protein NCCP2716_19060 [Sporosarcina sp. NCCP-2716]|nr:hypothetical protein NCCP2716_19060 [Sporosarcina sp. NCCP-2716]